jgi:hypothetical protein
MGRATRSTEPAANAGLDLVMPGPGGPLGERLVAAGRSSADQRLTAEVTVPA